jgi:hypothetical protein
LLEAKIAKQEARFEDVHYLLQRAACCEPPCAEQVPDGLCGDEDPCKEGCVANIPCLGPRLAQRKAANDCQRSYQAQIHLVRARVAAEQYDIGVAQRELGCACTLAADVCSYDLHAELHDVAALIHIAKGEYLQAARHLDQEAMKLRWAANYREIPTVVELASAAYEQAGLPESAADRLCRVARMLYGQGDLRGSWRYVESALPLAESAGAEATKVRLSLLANELLLAFSEQGESLPELPADQDESLGMIGPANALPSDSR